MISKLILVLAVLVLIGASYWLFTRPNARKELFARDVFVLLGLLAMDLSPNPHNYKWWLVLILTIVAIGLLAKDLVLRKQAPRFAR
ncbi:hypothetical protein [Lacticaseibacillus parakribbianus]|uniref:hypothetical protein n=1 Tax=Lacticaseibacillus parakribbianus TaxID=2970927 RepID=UPI0021CB6290|nr:hypothetical protein [Lacticaseibacillus parakribbianus]